MLQLAQRGKIEMIHVRVRQQDQIGPRQLAMSAAGATSRFSPTVMGPTRTPMRVLNTGRSGW